MMNKCFVFALFLFHCSFIPSGSTLANDDHLLAPPPPPPAGAQPDVPSDPKDQAEISYNIKEYAGINEDPLQCPGIAQTCTESCPLGHKRSPEGCLICECRTSGLFEGDIIVTDKTYDILLQKYGKDQPRGGLEFRGSEWPKAKGQVQVPYVLHASISTNKKDRIMEAMYSIERVTCVRFLQRDREADYVEFVGNKRGCKSWVGKQGDRQEIHLGDGCEEKLGTVIHEIMHALGFWHEQSRGDRDDYVTIVWKNVMDDQEKQFKKREQFWNSYGSPYDLSSVMHYSGQAFNRAEGLYTILDKKTGLPVQHQRNGLSKLDIEQINLKYKCQEAPTTVVMPTTQPPAAAAVMASCRDITRTVKCEEFKSFSLCDHAYLKKNCQKTCGHCTVVTTVTQETTTTQRIATEGTTTEATTTEATTTEATTVEATTAELPMQRETCMDVSSQCEFYMNKGYCSVSSGYRNYMEVHCKRSCDLCAKSKMEKCENDVSSCEDWSKRGYCGRYKLYMERKCKKACGHCGTSAVKDELITTPTTTTTTTTTPEPTTTTTTTKQVPCEDTFSGCAKWENNGFCQNAKYEFYMKEYCTKTCKFCQSATTTEPTTPKQITTTTPKPNTTTTITTTTKKTTTTTPFVAFSGECGVPAVDLSFQYLQRIVGGFTSTYGTIPWQVGLYTKGAQHICGAVLIDHQTVLTAAHCFIKDPKPKGQNYFLMLGKHHRVASIQDSGQVKGDIKKIIIHEKFNKGTLDNDIAVLKLKEPVDYTDHIRPACLEPTDEFNFTVGQSALVSGWGKTEDKNNRGDILQQVELKIVSNEMCNSWLYRVYKRHGEVSDNMLCAGYEQGEKDACQGDSGGPLVVRDGKRHVLIGLVSWGYGCADYSRPGIYTRVQNYLGWIHEKQK